MNPPTGSPAPLRLIARADDAGSARAANLGIAETARHGIIRNISVMAVGPALEHAAGLLADLPGIALGLHATLNSEWSGVRWGPVLPARRVPSLVGADGMFTAHPGILHERHFSLDELAAELHAQLNCLRTVGFRPGYIDTHMGFDWLPGAAAVVDTLAAREGLVREARSTHPALPRHPGSLAERLAAATGGPFVLITHPVLADPELYGFFNNDTPAGRVPAERDAERRALLDPALLQRVAEGSLVLETYAAPVR